jgi:hypothetical protein
MSPLTTPDRAIKHREADTVKKSRFFEAFDSRTRDEGALQSFESVERAHTTIVKRPPQQASNAHNRRQTAGSDWFSNITRANASN